MKIFFGLALLGAAVASNPVAAQVEPNSDFYTVREFYYQNTDGEWVEYRGAGFAGPKVEGVTPSLWVLPRMWVDRAAIRFVDANGEPFTPTSSTAVRVYSVNVPVAYDAKLPGRPQQAAIGAALKGEGINYFEQRPQLDNLGNPPMLPAATQDFQVRQLIMQSYQQRIPYFDALDRAVANYGSYSARAAALNEVKVALLIDGVEVASREYKGTQINYGGTLPAVPLVSPSIYQVNKIRNGDFELLVSFRFRDAKWAFVDGRFDAKLVIDQFIEETQTATTASSSSGWQVLGFGSRRKRLKQSLSQNFSYRDKVDRIENTRLVTFDATDDMVARFETAFFPEVAKQKVIESHLAAAGQADNEGRADLAKLHRDYVTAIQNDDPSLEVDINKAAAALSAGDYAGFIAHGVRFSNNDQTRTNNFRRVITRQVEIDEKREWLDYRQTSVQRETSIPLPIESSAEARGSLGLCDGQVGPFRIVRPFGQFQDVSALLVTCIQTGSPMARANVLPGTVIISINGHLPTSFQDLDQLLDSTRPGDEMHIRYVNGFGPQGTIIADRWVKLVRGKPVP